MLQEANLAKWLKVVVVKAIMATQEICFRVRISCCIFKRGRLKVEWFASDVENDAKFGTFWPPAPV